MDLSDSDDDILPSLGSINAMFKDVENKVRQAKSVCRLTPRKRHIEDDEISEGTKRLLAEIEKVTKQPEESTSTTDTSQRLLNADIVTPSGPFSSAFGGDMIQMEDSESEDIEVVEELISLRFRWKNEVLRYKVPRNTKIATIRMKIADKLSIRPDNIVIIDAKNSDADNRVAETVTCDETFDVFEQETCTIIAKGKNLDSEAVHIQVQGSGGYRNRCSFVIRKTTHVKQLVDDYSNKFGFLGKRFKLVVDGEDVDLSGTPESLDLENDDMLDVVEI